MLISDRWLKEKNAANLDAKHCDANQVSNVNNVTGVLHRFLRPNAQ